MSNAIRTACNIEATVCAVSAKFKNPAALIASAARVSKRCISQDTKAGAYPWILHPFLDLMFCCGGIVWLFFVLHFFGFGPDNLSKPVQIMLAFAALGGIALSETHVMATLARVYKSKSASKFAPRASLAAVACVILAVVSSFCPQFVPVLLKLYLLLVAQHFTAQSFGLTMLYCAKRGYSMNSTERKLLAILMQSTMWVAILRQLTWKDWSGNELMGFQIPFWGVLPPWISQSAELVVAGSALSLVVALIEKWRKEGKVFPLPAALMTITGVFVFLSGKQISDTLWLYVPAFFHGSQYICISLALYLKEKGLPEGMNTQQIGQLVTEPVALKYLAWLLLCALAFFQIFPFLVGLFGMNSAAVAASAFAAIHFHHFITDREIWKLRDADTRKLMLS